MPRNNLHKLSDQKLKQLKPSNVDQMYNDGGGLYLFLREYKSKEWIFRYTSPITNTRRKQTLGSYPDTSLQKARQLASQKRDLLDRGLDPIIEFENNTLIEQKALSDKKEQQSQTVEIIFDLFKREELQNRKDGGKDMERTFRKDVFPVIGKKPIAEITRIDIRYVLERPLKRHAYRVANILLTDLKQFFKYVEDEELITKNPTRAFQKDRVGGKENSRKRVLSEDEILILKNKLNASNLSKRYVHAIYLYLATGLRRSELVSTPLINIDEIKRTFYVPPEKSKNTDAHIRYLSDFALEQVAAIKKLTKNDIWLLPNRRWTNHLTEAQITKLVTTRQPQQEKRGLKKRSTRRKYDNSLALPNGHWIIHDLRRTAATIMQQHNIAPYVIKKCLNQRIEDEIVETYQRAELIEQQKHAFEVLGAYLNMLINEYEV